MGYNDNSAERTFNKDIAFLMELQRLEYISNNYAIEGNCKARLRTLECWRSAICEILSEKDLNKISMLKEKCKPVKYQGSETYNSDSINEYHEYLNRMNTRYKLQLGKRDSGVEAAKID